MKHRSGGMKQKLGLICTLIHEPELLILDEPTTGVDPVSRRDLWTILAQLLRERAVTVLVSTAYMDEATRFHRAALFFDGRILAQGEPDELVHSIAGKVVILHAEPQAEARARLHRRFSHVEALGSQLRVFVEETDPEAAVRHVEAALTNLRVKDLRMAEPELEDIFIALLRNHRQSMHNTPFDSPHRDLPVAPAGRQHIERQVAIEAEALVRDFDGFRAVDRVSFCVPRGEIFGLLGANGAGKTTVIKMLAGILSPTSGTGRVAGADMRRAAQHIKERIGYVSQAFSLYHELTVVENIRLYAGIYGLSRAATRERLDWIVTMADLAGQEMKQAGSLPLGMSQRLALGCALVHRPQILFLDEPTSGVDPIGRRLFWDLLFRLSRDEGVTILMTTHYMEEAEHCDRLALMYAGRVVAGGSPADMKQHVEAAAGQIPDLVTDQPMRAVGLLEQAGFVGVSLFGKHLHLLSSRPDTDIDHIRHVLDANDVRVQAIERRPLTLEDVFVYRIAALEKREHSM